MKRKVLILEHAAKALRDAEKAHAARPNYDTAVAVQKARRAHDAARRDQIKLVEKTQ